VDPENKHISHIETILKALPNNPGVYQFFDESERIIYVGKAKNLKKRVVSYFKNEGKVSAKITVMVRKIADIKFIIVEPVTITPFGRSCYSSVIRYSNAIGTQVVIIFTTGRSSLNPEFIIEYIDVSVPEYFYT